MNHYTFDEIAVGHSESFTHTVTDEQMELFCRMTGDVSPIHMDEQVARARGHKDRVVYGMLGASLFSTLAGVWLPGENCLLHSVEAKFVKPVYIGDTLTVTGTVTDKNDTFHTLTIKAVITNQDGQKVTRGTIQAGVEGKSIVNN